MEHGTFPRIIYNVNVNVHFYSPNIPVSSADCTIVTPDIGADSVTVSLPLVRNQHVRLGSAAPANLSVSFN